AGFSRIEPAHVRARSKLHARPQDSLDQLLVTLFRACSRPHTRSAGRRRHYDGRLRDVQVEAAIKSRGKVEKDAFLAYLLKLFVGYIVTVFDGIGTGIDRGLYA